MKDVTNKHNKDCFETNLLLSQYGFVEEYETVVRNNKLEKLRFLYLQLKPTIGLLVYNFYHTDTKRNLQGFDMFMYDSNSIKDAIYQFHGHNKHKRLGIYAAMLSRLYRTHPIDIRPASGRRY